MVLLNEVSTNWYQTIGKISEQARKSGKPFCFFIGEVLKENPLSIKKNSKITLTEPFLILSNAVVDHELEVEVDWETDTGDKITGTKKIMVKSGLKNGEKVLLLQQEGGQQYLVVDRVNEVKT